MLIDTYEDKSESETFRKQRTKGTVRVIRLYVYEYITCNIIDVWNWWGLGEPDDARICISYVATCEWHSCNSTKDTIIRNLSNQDLRLNLITVSWSMPCNIAVLFLSGEVLVSEYFYLFSYSF
jgi:hypothetical protein